MYKLPLFEPQSWMEPVMVPLILTFFGVLVFALGLYRETSGRKAHWKWMGIVILAIGAIFGSRYTYWYFGPDAYLYITGFVMKGARMRISHALSLGLPVFGIIACIAAIPLVARRNRMLEDAYAYGSDAVSTASPAGDTYAQAEEVEAYADEEYDEEEDLYDGQYEDEYQEETGEHGDSPQNR